MHGRWISVAVTATLVAVAAPGVGCQAGERDRTMAQQDSPAPPLQPLPKPVAIRTPPELADLRFAPDGGALFAIRDGVLYRVSTSGRLRALRRLAGPSGAVSPDARRVAEFRERHGTQLVLRRREGGRPLFRTRLPRSRFDRPLGIWSPDGARLLVDTEGRRRLRVFDARRGRLLRALVGGSLILTRQPWSPDGRRIAVVRNGGLVLIDVRTGRPRLLKREEPWPIAWSPDGRTLAGAIDGQLMLIDARSGDANALPLRAGITEIAWSPDSRRLAVFGNRLNSETHALWVVDVADDGPPLVRVLRDRVEPPFEQTLPTWSPSGTQLAFQVER